MMWGDRLGTRACYPVWQPDNGRQAGRARPRAVAASRLMHIRQGVGLPDCRLPSNFKVSVARISAMRNAFAPTAKSVNRCDQPYEIV